MEFFIEEQQAPLNNNESPEAFVQHYGEIAIECFNEGEDPTLALMALMPFKIGKFYLSVELYHLLFSQKEFLTEE